MDTLKIEDIQKEINQLKSENIELGQYLKDLEILSQYQGQDEVVSSHKLYEKIQEESKREVLKINTLIPTLDKYIGGFREGQVVVVSAPTGMGKTTLCQTLTMNFSQQNIKCLWLSYEVGAEEFFSKFTEIPLFYMPQTLKQNSLEWLEQRVIESIAKYNCKVIFIDHLHYLLEMQKMAEAKSISLLIGMMMREIKKMAIKHKVIVFLISHIRKAILDKEKLPDIDDLRDSSFVGQESDCVLFLKRYKDGEDWTNKSALKIAKNRRSGNLGIVKLIFENGKFTELTEEKYYPYE